MTILEKILSIILVVALAYIGLNYFVSSEMSDNTRKTWAAMNDSEFSCPVGTEPRMDGWSKTGYSRICTKLKQGRWEAWDLGYKHIEGNYLDGKKHGTWTFFREDGSVYNTVEYVQGKEVKRDTNKK